MVDYPSRHLVAHVCMTFCRVPYVYVSAAHTTVEYVMSGDERERRCVRMYEGYLGPI